MGFYLVFVVLPLLHSDFGCLTLSLFYLWIEMEEPKFLALDAFWTCPRLISSPVKFVNLVLVMFGWLWLDLRAPRKVNVSFALPLSFFSLCSWFINYSLSPRIMYVQEITRMTLCDKGFGGILAEKFLHLVIPMASPFMALWNQNMVSCSVLISIALGLHICACLLVWKW